MKRILYVIVCLACLCWQCKEKKEVTPAPSEIKEIDVLDFAVPGVDAKNIIVKDDLIIVNLPENYAKGDYIKPDIIFGTGYSSQSPILNGIAYEGQEIKLSLESTTRQPKTFNVIVVPYKAIELSKPAENFQVVIVPEMFITASFELNGTRESVNDSAKIVSHPLVRLTNKNTGQIIQELLSDFHYRPPGEAWKFPLPAATVPGDYIAEIVWGSKKVVLAPLLTFKPGPIQLERGSWRMLEGDRYFEITGYNMSPTNKYEAIIYNDLIAPQRIALQFKKPGTLSGNLPEPTLSGNYKITYLVNGKEQKAFLAQNAAARYMGDDNFYVQKTSTQPFIRILSQPSQRSNIPSGLGFDNPYYPSPSTINRKEPILAYIQWEGAFNPSNKLILVNSETRREYALPYVDSPASLFDAFIVFHAYNITREVPDGKYEVYVVAQGTEKTEKTEKYSQIITLK